MLLRTKLVLAYSALVVCVVGTMLAIAVVALDDVAREGLNGANRALAEMTEDNYRLSERVLTAGGERIVATVARSTANELSLLLSGRAISDYPALRADPELRAVATRDILALNRVAGYVDVLDRHGVAVWHPNPGVEGRNFAEWRERYPEMWALVVRSFSETEVTGYYNFFDRDDRPQRKYMVLHAVPNTPFIVAAVVNIEDFFLPVHREIGSAGRKVSEAMTQRIAAATAAEMGTVKSLVFAAGFVALLGAGLLALWLARLVSRPLSRLRDGVIRLGSGDFSVEVPEKGSSEIRELARIFNRLGGELADYTARLAGEAAAREAVESEVRIARRIQESMLPGPASPCLGRPEFELYGLNREAREVGGDFYDYFFLDDKRLVVMIADVSGKGIPAALFMAVSRTLLKEACGRTDDPAVALDLVNRSLSGENEACMFVTVFLAFYDIGTGRLDYANGGHPEPWLIPAAGGLQTFGRLGDPVVGVMEEHVFRRGRIELQPGDTVFLYTDGVTEAMSPDNEAFGNDRLEGLLGKCAPLSAEAMGGRIAATVDDYQAGCLFDDITLVILRRRT